MRLYLTVYSRGIYLNLYKLFKPFLSLFIDNYFMCGKIVNVLTNNALTIFDFGGSIYCLTSMIRL